jgi:flagellar hook assembly protein FlgD
LTLTYKFDEPASVANLHIYNAEGRIVKTILKDEILQEKGFFIWDGTDSNGNKASVGIYFIILDVVETNGRKTIFKEKCVLATPLN